DLLPRLGLDEAFVASTARGLGLVDGPPPAGQFTHVIVLGGMVKACVNRSTEAARLRDELGIERVVLLTAHRPLQGAEPSDGRASGWGDLELESQAAEAAARGAFDMAPTPFVTATHTSEPSEPRLDLSPEELREQRRRRSWAHSEFAAPGGTVDLVVAASSD